MKYVIVVLAENSNIVMVESSLATNVAVGVILNDDAAAVLISKRRPGQSFEGYWEFPGGKHEENETPLEALTRELNEEIGITLTKAQPFLEITHRYAERLVCLHVWLVHEFMGEPAGIEGQECKWVNITDLHEYHFPEGNQQIILELRRSIYEQSFNNL